MYGSQTVISKIISLALVSIYLKFLGPEDFGLYDYILAVGVFLGVTVSLELSQSLHRFLPELKNEQRITNAIFYNSFLIVAMNFFLLLSITYFFSDFIQAKFLAGPSTKHTTMLALLFFTLNALFYIQSSFFVALQHVKYNFVHNVGYQLLSGGFAVFSFVWFEASIDVLLFSHAFALLILIIISGIYIHSKIGFIGKKVIDFGQLKIILAFSLPLIPSSLGVILSTFADRIMIKEFLGYDELGVYGLGLRVASIGMVLVMAVRTAITPMIYESYENPITTERLALLFNMYIAVMVLTVTLLPLYSLRLINLIANETFSNTTFLLPSMVMFTFVSNAYMFFPGLFIRKKTILLSIISLIGTSVNILLNLIFIPKFGLIGAAHATLASGVFTFSCQAYFSNKYYPMYKFHWLIFILSAVIAFYTIRFLVDINYLHPIKLLKSIIN